MDHAARAEAVQQLLRRPIFIAGRGRSGTSLLHHLFDGHPGIVTLYGEGRLFTELVPRLRSSGDREAAAIAIELRFPLRRNQTDPGLSARLAALDIASPLLARDILTIGLDRWLRRHPPKGPAVYLEKTPKNEEHLPSLFGNFPGARVVYVVRDPRGVYVSNRRSEQHRMSPAFLAEQWVKSVRRVLPSILDPEADAPIHLVRFEALVETPRATLERLCAVLDLPWSDSLLAPTTVGRPWGGNAYADDKLTPDGVAAHKAGEWRGEITFEEEAAIIAVAGAEMSLLGYPSQSATGSRANISS